MSILNQKTINKKITFKGVGLHTGMPVELNLLPIESIVCGTTFELLSPIEGDKHMYCGKYVKP